MLAEGRNAVGSKFKGAENVVSSSRFALCRMLGHPGEILLSLAVAVFQEIFNDLPGLRVSENCFLVLSEVELRIWRRACIAYFLGWFWSVCHGVLPHSVVTR